VSGEASGTWRLPKRGLGFGSRVEAFCALLRCFSSEDVVETTVAAWLKGVFIARSILGFSVPPASRFCAAGFFCWSWSTRLVVRFED
jgi:hypothetical protein